MTNQPKWDWDQYVAADYESSGRLPEYALQTWRFPRGDAWVTSLAWVWREGKDMKIDGGLNPSKMETARLIEFCLDTRRILVGWNLVYDLGVMIALGFEKWVHELRVLDGMLLWRHLEIEPEYEFSGPSKKSYALKGKPDSAVPTFLPKYKDYADDVDYHSTDPAELKKLHDYNIKDNLFALKIASILYERMSEKRLRAFWVEQSVLSMVAAANFRGMRIDTFQSHDLVGKLTKTANDSLALLAPHGVTEAIVRSPVQLSKLMFDDWKLPVWKMNTSKKTKDENGNPKKSRSTDKEVLHELAIQDPRAKTLRAYREALNNRTKFANALIKSVAYNGDGCAHPQGRVFGTYTSRFTYSSAQGKGKAARPIGFAIHQMKNEAQFRDQLIAPPGYTLLEWDAAGQEFKWMAIASGDLTMLGLCQPGEDPHSFMTSKVYGLDYQQCLVWHKTEDKIFKPKRKMGKVGNLSLQYRTSAPKFLSVARVQYDIDMVMSEAQLIHRTYPQTYPGVPQYWQRQIAITKQLGYVETFAGRRVKVVGDWNGSWGWSMGSTSINYKIQGTGGDQKCLALQHLKDLLPKYDAHFLLDMHDGLYVLVPDRYAMKLAQEGKETLDNLPYGAAWNFLPPVPLPFDVKMGKSWGSLRGVEFD
jgi:DNA polymerase-1